MTWFAASLFYKGVGSDGDTTELWEERIALIDAGTPEEALVNAQAIGAKGNVSYEVSNGVKYEWTFFQVERIFEIQSEMLLSGTEVFSRFLRKAEAASLLTPFEEEE